MQRRKFIKGLASGAAVTAASAPAIATAKNKKFRWKLATTWPPKMPILQEGPEMFAKKVKEATDGRLRIKVFAGGELIPPLGVFDAVSQGTIEMGVGSPYYWAGKAQATQFFGSMPFGFNPQQFNAWLTGGGGQELWEELYKPFSLVPMAIGNTGLQTGGWFNKQINSLADLKGLKMRIPGFGGKVMAKAGVNVVLMPGGEIYTALERGTVDACEWISPFHDERMGLHRAAKFCYYPGWHEPSSNIELSVHKSAWDELPKDIQQIVRSCATETLLWSLSQSEAKNGAALERLKTKYKVQVLPFPDDVLKGLKKHSEEVIAELVKSDPFSAKVYKSYSKFNKEIMNWAEISEEAYAAARRLKKTV